MSWLGAHGQRDSVTRLVRTSAWVYPLVPTPTGPRLGYIILLSLLRLVHSAADFYQDDSFSCSDIRWCFVIVLVACRRGHNSWRKRPRSLPM
eukprot:3795005-Pyramimonas_sp.AAC.1